MKFLSVRKGASGPLNIGGNELTLAGVVKEDLACPGSSLPEKSYEPQAGPSFELRAGQFRMILSFILKYIYIKRQATST
jgi:hypothetical protein